MKYDFPYIRHIDDVLPAIKDSPEFIVADKGDYKVVNYMVSTPDTFPPVSTAGGSAKEREYKSRMKALRRECRGLIFDKDGWVLARRLHKFFNVGERDETLPHKIDLSQPHRVLEKLDGSMITPIRIGDNLRYGTKMGITDTSMEAEVFVANNPHYDDFCWLWVERGWTPIFEWCSRKNRVVIDHPEDRLVLIALRNNTTGEYHKWEVTTHYAETYGIEHVKAREDFFDDMEELITSVSPGEDTEGVVVRFDDGHMLKVKTEWYVRIHKARDSLMHEKDVLKMILEEKMDDVIGFLPEADADKLLAFAKEFWFGIAHVSAVLTNEIRGARTVFQGEKKAFALGSGSLSNEFRAAIFKHWTTPESELRGEVRFYLIDLVKKSLASQSRVDAVRWAFNDAEWSY